MSESKEIGSLSTLFRRRLAHADLRAVGRRGQSAPRHLQTPERAGMHEGGKEVLVREFNLLSED